MNPARLRPELQQQVAMQLGHGSFTPHFAPAGKLLPVREVKKPRGAAKDLFSKKRKELERLALVFDFFILHNIPFPIGEFRFHPKRLWRFDFAWPERKIALEVEGGMWIHGRHSRGSGRIKDMEKYSAAAVLGWRLLYVQPKELLTAQTAEMIKGALQIAA